MTKETKIPTDQELKTMENLSVWHVGSGLRLIGLYKKVGGAPYLKDAVRIDIDVLGRNQQGSIVKSPIMGSIDYSMTPIPKYYIDKGKPHYWVRDLDEESKKATISVYSQFCANLNNWEEKAEEVAAAAKRGPQSGGVLMPAGPGAMNELNRLASMMMPGSGGGFPPK